MKPLPLTVARVMRSETGTSEALFYRLAAFIGICTILYFGKDILIPVVVAVLLATLLSPVVRGLQRIRFPKSLAVILVVTIIVVSALGAAFLVGRALTNLASDLPSYEANLRMKARSINVLTSNGDALEKAAGVIKGLQVELEKSTSPESQATRDEPKPVPVEIRETNLGPLDPLIRAMSVIVHPLVQLGIIVLMLTFILFNREDLRDRFIRLAGTKDLHRTTVALEEAGTRLSRMFIGQIAINAGVGTFIGGSLFLLGIPGAFLWGLLTTILRFVPFVGTIMASLFPIVIALAVGDGWTLPIIVLGIVLGAEIVTGHVLEPVFLGKMTGVSSTAIVVSVAFWAILWGPVGLILATPMTIGLLVIGRNIESMQFLDVLFGSEPVLSAPDALYQRLLAGDAIEAAEAAGSYEAQGRLANYLEDVAIPALALAAADQLNGILSKEMATSVAATFSDTLEDIWSDQKKFEREATPVVLIANHGPINFAATLAFSALLHIKRVPHQMLPQNAILPGGFPEINVSLVNFACLVSLHAPTPAQLRYIERRLTSRIGNAKLLNIAFIQRGEAGDVMLASRAVSMLPHESNGDSNKTADEAANSGKPATVTPS